MNSIEQTGCGSVCSCASGAAAAIPVNPAISAMESVPASVNGVAMHGVGEQLGAEALRERAYAELLRQQAVRLGWLPEQAVTLAPELGGEVRREDLMERVNVHSARDPLDALERERGEPHGDGPAAGLFPHVDQWPLTRVRHPVLEEVQHEGGHQREDEWLNDPAPCTVRGTEIHHAEHVRQHAEESNEQQTPSQSLATSPGPGAYVTQLHR